MRPIRPDEIVEAKRLILPDGVIECWNELIARSCSGGTAIIKQDDAIGALMAKTGIENRQEIFNLHYLDVEDMYRAAGWKVVYDKPGFNESYPASFTFTKSKKSVRC